MFVSRGSVATHMTCGGIFNKKLCCKFIAESDGEKISNIGWELTELRLRVSCLFFGTRRIFATRSNTRPSNTSNSVKLVSPLPRRLWTNMTSSTKPEAHNVTTPPKQDEPRPQTTCIENSTKFGHVKCCHCVIGVANCVIRCWDK